MEQSGTSMVTCAHTHRVMRHQGKPVLEMDLESPKISDTKQAQLGRFYRRVAEAWRSRWEKEVFPLACAALEENGQMQAWQMRLRYHVSYEQDGLLSLYTEASEQYDRRRTLLIRNAETWSVEDAMPRSLYSFLPEQRFPRAWLLRQLMEQANAQHESGEHLYHPEYPRLMRRYFDPARFYLTPEGIALYYPLESIAPYAEGLPSFFLPCRISDTTQSNSGKAS